MHMNEVRREVDEAKRRTGDLLAGLFGVAMVLMLVGLALIPLLFMGGAAVVVIEAIGGLF